MKEMVRYGATLAIICAIASASLALMNKLTQPHILAQAHAREESSLRHVLPQAERFDAVGVDGEVSYYKAYSSDGKLLGGVFKAAGKGYSSVVETMAGITLDGKITAIVVISQNETPGLGVRVTEPAFTSRFVGKDEASLGTVQAISGATISSRAVINSVRSKSILVLKAIKNER